MIRGTLSDVVVGAVWECVRAPNVSIHGTFWRVAEMQERWVSCVIECVSQPLGNRNSCEVSVHSLIQDFAFVGIDVTIGSEDEAVDLGTAIRLGEEAFG